MTTSTALDRVQRGIALLDAQRPGWTSKIDLSELDLSSVYSCVLGQVFSDEARVDATPWGIGMQTLLDDTWGGWFYGFDRDSANDESYEELQQVWESALSEKDVA